LRYEPNSLLWPLREGAVPDTAQFLSQQKHAVEALPES